MAGEACGSDGGSGAVDRLVRRGTGGGQELLGLFAGQRRLRRVHDVDRLAFAVRVGGIEGFLEQGVDAFRIP